MFKIILVILGLFVSNSAFAQNVTCATRPAGDSTNACASTAFVHTSISNIIHGTPSANQFTTWFDATHIQGITSTQATALLNSFTGDSGAGGIKGLVPAPAAGDAAAGKVLGAGGNWTGITTGACINAHIAYGANGTAGDGARIQSALNAAQAPSGPGCVFLPAIGGPYIIDTGISIPAGVSLFGVGSMYYNGLTATVAQWTVQGTWLECTDMVNYCVSIASHGSLFDGVNLIWNQVVPTTGTYVPTVFPDGIHITGTLFRVRNSLMVGGTRCVVIDYSGGSGGGGTYSELSNLKMGCLSRGVLGYNINDDVYVRDIDVRPLWYILNTSLLNFVEGSLVGFDMHYWDNILLVNYQCIFCEAAFQFTNGTSLGNTHSLYNGQLVNVQCNLVRICMLTTSGATVSFRATNIQAQQDTSNGLTDTLFQFQTDYLDAGINSLDVITAGASVMTIGNGVSGHMKIGELTLGTNVSGVNVYGYSALSAGQTAIVVNAGADLSIAQRRVLRSGTAGAFISGVGADNVEMPTYCWAPTYYPALLSSTGTGSYVGLTGDNYVRTNYYGDFLQARIEGQANVTTAAAGTATVRMSNWNSVAATFSTSTTGAKTLNSGWIDIADTGSQVGGLQINAPSSSVSTFGPLVVCGR